MNGNRRSGQKISFVFRETTMKRFVVLLALMMATVSLATVHTVNVNALSFSPANLTIQQGDTVRWIKPAGGFHNVEESNNNPPVFRSGDPTSSAFTYNFAFAAPLSGTFNYECIVHAASGMVGTVTVEAGGNPPSTPSNPIPNNGATGMPALGFLIWEDEGATGHSVQFGTTNPPPTVNDNFGGMMFPYSGLTPNTQYFWKITAFNEHGETEGPLWSFTTAGPPPQVTGPFPDDDATNVPVTTTLAWEPSSGANGYEVYFGTSEPLQLATTTTQTTFDPPGDLATSTVYLWRVDAFGDAGSTTGLVWSFTTEAGSSAENPAAPQAFQLQAAYPNPFNSNVRIGLTVAQESPTVVRIFDIVGQEVATLVDSKLSAGEYQLEWNAAGNAAGLYFLKCECAGLTQTQKLIYLP